MQQELPAAREQPNSTSRTATSPRPSKPPQYSSKDPSMFWGVWVGGLMTQFQSPRFSSASSSAGSSLTTSNSESVLASATVCADHSKMQPCCFKTKPTRTAPSPTSSMAHARTSTTHFGLASPMPKRQSSQDIAVVSASEKVQERLLTR